MYILNIISLVLGVGAWVVATIAIAKSARSYISTVLSFSLCAFSLVTELFEISRRVNLGDYAAIEDTIRAVIIAYMLPNSSYRGLEYVVIIISPPPSS